MTDNIEFIQLLYDASDDIIRLFKLQREGKVLFICGAGVSKKTGLPLFKGLIEDIYSDLGRNRSTYPDEVQAFEDQQYDHVLRCIDVNEDLPANRPSIYLGSLRKILKKPERFDSTFHNDLLSLSINRDRQSRLVTTNFDCLFEHSRNDLESHAWKGLPDVNGSKFFGTIHIHGRLGDETLGLDETDLVLTSSDFGEAYLRSGALARYVYDLARAFNLVFVGYSLGDHVVHLIMQTIAEDRKRFDDLKQAYAFVHLDGQPLESQKAIWRSKGVIPICYPPSSPTIAQESKKQPQNSVKTPSNDDYSWLYKFIAQWRQFSDDQSEWLRQYMKPIASHEFEALPIFQQQAIRTIIALTDVGVAERLYLKLNVPFSWVVAFNNERLEVQNEAAGQWLSIWVAKNLGDSNAIIKLANGGQEFYSIRNWIDFDLDHPKSSSRRITKTFRRAARLAIDIAKFRQAQTPSFSRYYLNLDTSNQVFSNDQIENIVDLVTPAISVQSPYVQERGKSVRSVNQIFRMNFSTEGFRSPSNHVGHLDLWIRQRTVFLKRLFEHLRGRLTTILDLAHRADALLFLAWDVHSVSRHDQDKYSDDIYPLIRIMADVLETLIKRRGEKLWVLGTLDNLLQSSFSLERRVGLFGFSILMSRFPGRAFDAFMALPDEHIWETESRREIMLFLSNRWQGFTPDQKSQIEKRLLRGLPAKRRRNLKPELAIWIRDNLLLWIDQYGGGLITPDAQEASRKSERRLDERDSFNKWSSGEASWVGEFDTIPQDEVDFVTKPSKEIISYLDQFPEDTSDHDSIGLKSRLNFLAQQNPKALVEVIKAKQDDTEFTRLGFKALFDYIPREHDDQSLHQVIVAWASKITLFDDIAELEFLTSVARFMREHATSFINDGEPITPARNMIAYQIRFFGNANYKDGVDSEDVMMDALNHPGGWLAQILIAWLDAKQKSGLVLRMDNEFGGLLSKLVSLTNKTGKLARAICINSLDFFYHHDTDWTQTYLLPRLNHNNAEAHEMWEARSHGGRFHDPALFNLLANNIIELIRTGTSTDQTMAHYVDWVLSDILTNQIFKSRKENLGLDDNFLRQFLDVDDQRVRENAINALTRWLENEKKPKIREWSAIAELVFNCWPTRTSARSEESSISLFRFAVTHENLFPKFFGHVEPLIGFSDFHHVYSISGSNDDKRDITNRIIDKFPAEYLELLALIIDPDNNRIPGGLSDILDRISTAASKNGILQAISHDPRFMRLRSFASNHA